MATPVDPERTARRDANWALALGIVSLAICAPITAPFAFWKAIRALRVNGASAPAIVGIVCAILGLLSSALFWFLLIWQILTPSDRGRSAP